MTSAVAGRVQKLAVSADNGANYYDLGELLDTTLSLSGATIDAKSKDSAGFEEYIPGFVGGTIDGSVVYVEGNTAQGIVLDALLSHTTILVRHRGVTGTGYREYTGITAIVTKFEDGAPVEDKQTSAFGLQLSGDPSPAAQS